MSKSVYFAGAQFYRDLAIRMEAEGRLQSLDYSEILLFFSITPISVDQLVKNVAEDTITGQPPDVVSDKAEKVHRNLKNA